MRNKKPEFEIGSKHEFEGFGNIRKHFFWTGEGWATQARRVYYTKPGVMGVLGWKYLNPCPEAS